MGHESLGEADRAQPVDTEQLALETRLNADGWPEVRYRNEWHPVPSYGTIEDWIFDVSHCETPDGSTVEPDDPNSWLSLLALI